MKYKPCCLLLVLFWFANLHSVPAQNPAFIFSSLPGVGSDPECVIAADVNGDGKLDLISANFHDGTLTVLTNNGSGDFVLSSSPFVGMAYSVCAADVNGDGKLDLIAPNFYGSSLMVLTNDGTGGFELASTPTVGADPDSVCAADVNGDGKVDLICANYWRRRQHADGIDERWAGRLCPLFVAQRGHSSSMRRRSRCQRGWQSGFDLRKLW